MSLDALRAGDLRGVLERLRFGVPQRSSVARALVSRVQSTGDCLHALAACVQRIDDCLHALVACARRIGDCVHAFVPCAQRSDDCVRALAACAQRIDACLCAIDECVERIERCFALFCRSEPRNRWFVSARNNNVYPKDPHSGRALIAVFAISSPVGVRIIPFELRHQCLVATQRALATQRHFAAATDTKKERPP